MAPWLSEAGLAALPQSVIRPAYDRSVLEPGIVHLGVGNFHRAHQAVYTDDVLAQDPRWGIVGVSLRHADMRDALAPQQGLYALLEQGAGRPERARIVGSLREVRVAPHEPEAIVRRLADPATRIVSLTITEKGYCRTPGGELDLDDAAVRADLDPGAQPSTALGFVLAACARRQAAGLPGFTVLSCDNLAASGDMTRALLLRFADARGRAASASRGVLTRWIEQELAFPNGMVDRIVPHTTDALRDRMQGLLGMRDRWPVSTESFSQWVLEDRFVAGRPPWQLAGVQFVADVAPYEDMKLRLLNAAHSAIAYLGVPACLDTVDAAVAQPAVRAFVERFWRTEAIGALPEDLRERAAPYCQALMNRFENTALAHRTAQIAMDGSQKLPLRLLPTVRARLHQGACIDACALVLAAWIRFLGGRTESGQAYEISDPLSIKLRAALSGGDGSAADLVGAVLSVPGLFGADLADHAGLRGAVTRELAGLLRLGTIGWLAQWPHSGQVS
ncbi:MAG: mannitol dehydrogenase family protein [Burkholderiaceae bacterium]|nr:mannitol dehydrogenase family protein [Burkholderiaceae bacterium]